MRDLKARGGADPLTHERAVAMRREMRALLTKIEQVSVAATKRSVVLTVHEIAAIHREVTRTVIKAEVGATAAAQAARAFSRVPARAVAAINARRENAATFQTLIKRSVQDAVPQMDNLISRAVAQGMAPDRLTNDVAKLLSGNDPALADYELASKEVSGIRTLFSDARRIAVSETNNALREANTIGLQESPVIAATWQRSGRHDASGKPDECDDLAEDDRDGYGAGIYLVSDWPLAPHPYCACTQGGPVIYMPFDEWLGMRGIDSGEEVEEEEALA